MNSDNLRQSNSKQKKNEKNIKKWSEMKRNGKHYYRRCRGNCNKAERIVERLANHQLIHMYHIAIAIITASNEETCEIIDFFITCFVASLFCTSSLHCVHSLSPQLQQQLRPLAVWHKFSALWVAEQKAKIMKIYKMCANFLIDSLWALRRCSTIGEAN